MKILFIVIGVLTTVAVIVYAWGSMLPVKHSATFEADINGSPDEVWKRINEPAAFPTWRSDLKTVEVKSPAEWIEHGKYGDIPFRKEEVVPQQKLVTVINSKGLSFGGEWIYVLSANNKGTHISITENGEVYSPAFRFISKYFMGHNSSLKKYIADLQSSFKS